MHRRKFLKNGIFGLLGAEMAGILSNSSFFSIGNLFKNFPKKNSFGKDFTWGTTTAAFQIEGACDTDGKSPSIWDTFTNKKNKIRNNQKATTAVDFYNRYQGDIGLVDEMNFSAFRFSLSWPRIMPEGAGRLNPKGIDFYNRVIDTCLADGVEPWITIYHWDLPQALEDRGGWTNRDIIGWFSDYTDACTNLYGDRVKNWIILNEPMSFTGLGYFTGYHAPGRKGVGNFLPAAHHAALCQAEGGRIAKRNVKNANIGTTFSFADIHPLDDSERNVRAAEKLDVLFNRLFIEPVLGLGYPFESFPALKRIEKYIKQDDEKKLAFEFDFLGVQYYFRLVSSFSLWPPILFAKEIPAEKRNVVTNSMGFEVFPEGLYKILERVNGYQGVKKIIISECGVCFDDRFEDGKIHDIKRLDYLKETLSYTAKAIENGMRVNGYFVWSLTDNFEWSEGFDPRFGLVYVDYHDLRRYIKDSGLWFKDFLK